MVYALPGRRGAKIGRVDIGAQQMTRNAGRGFDGQDILGGEALGGLKPFPNGSLRYAAKSGESRLRTSLINRLFKRVAGSGV